MKSMRLNDKLLKTQLNKLSHEDASYWEFRRQAMRDGVHGLLQYPAMMVPTMQRDVLRQILSVCPEITRVLDPFVGSGTVMTESMLAGLDFTGIDINPLAILTCKAKSHLHQFKKFETKARALAHKIQNDTARKFEVNFFGRDKWFSRSAIFALSKIRRAIQNEESLWAREIFWIVLAETIRQTSNSRTSTYKLHLRPPSEIQRLKDPIEVFLDRLNVACKQFHFHGEKSLAASNSGVQILRPTLKCRNTSENGTNGKLKYDLVLTSPPYGDNHSTVPYGQFSYLALSWIDSKDLPHGAEHSLNTRSIDSNSLGGKSLRKRESVVHLENSSPSFKKFIGELRKQRRPDLENKVCSFTNDFFDSIISITNSMNPDSYAAWTLGNRTVGGIVVPLTEICLELHQAIGATHVNTIRRRIPSKRTPIRNAISKTMSDESLLLVRV